jgi:hypothetical protein
MNIKKTWQKATYFDGKFKLFKQPSNMAYPVSSPIVFIAYGAGIKSGNWKSCTSISNAEFVITHYFNGIGNNKHDAMFSLWEYCKQLDALTWDDDMVKAEELVNKANKELDKLKSL